MVVEKRLIDANALFEFLKEQRDKETGSYSKGRNNGINVAIGAIRNEQICPTVDAVEVVHGRWIKKNWSVTCSVCGSLAIAHDGKNYCPYCGAKMDGGNEDV